jgi:general stress protein 26
MAAIIARMSQDDSNKARIRNILKGQKLAVISTVDPNSSTPESALIAFAEDEQLNLYFQTGRHTRKAANLDVNPAVSLVIGLALNDYVTVQYEGRADRLTAPEDLEACRRRFVAKDSPTTEEYFNHPTAIFFKVTPVWIGCSDYSKDRPEVIELRF